MLTIPFIVSLTEQETPPGRPRGTIHFNEETISLCHPERSEGSLAGQRSFAALRMTLLHRLRLTRNTSYSPGIAPSISSFRVLRLEHGLFEMYCPLRSSWFLAGQKQDCSRLSFPTPDGSFFSY